ncbi:ATP-dependent helicase/deoxyribonuclease subunit B [Geodia barretti]|uniref:ATP-dependent helicase/deoxyribonuclease subunit B n=1 Tax=Geodia barretti TaxID=519541 RepID=A0AA35QRX6_GEOBA|nr:ATP-dependent helicase/deoxyribonuclease subunit B [Geodia barretti]
MNTPGRLIVGHQTPERLRDAVDSLKRPDPSGPLAPVTVVGPSNYANLSLRHFFARTGFVNVRFMVFSRLAEFLGAPRMAREGRTPLTRVIESAAVRSVAANASGPLGDLSRHPSTLHSLKQSFRELRSIPPSSLDALARSSDLQSETVRLYRQFKRDTSRFYDDEDLASAAAESVDDQPASGFDDLGTIVFYAPRDITPGQLKLIEALSRRERCVVMLDQSGDPIADGYVYRLVNRLSSAPGTPQTDVTDPLPQGADRDRYSYFSPSPQPSPSGREGLLGLPAPVSADGEGADTHLVIAPDPNQEIRWVIRDVIRKARGSTPFSRMAVLYRKPDYGKIVAEEMELAGVPVAGPDQTTLAETAVGRTLIGLMELADGDFQRGLVTSLLTGCPVRSPDRSIRLNPSRWDRLSKEAGIVRGIGQWRDRLEKYAARQEESISDPTMTSEMSEGRLRGIRAQAESAQELLAFVDRLYDDLQPPAQDASWVDFSEWTRKLVDDYVSRGSGTPEPELNALEKVQDILSELTAASTVAPRPSFQTFREDLYEALQIPTGRLGEMGKGVFVASFRIAAAMRFDAVYLVGMIEGAAPPAARDDPLIPSPPVNAPEARQPDSRCSRTRGPKRDATTCPRSAALPTRPSQSHSSELKRMGDRDWLTLIPSAESGLLDGDATDAADVLEYDLRHLLRWRTMGQGVARHPFAAGAPLGRALQLGSARYSSNFTEWDGNASSIARESRYRNDTINRTHSPTRLERWAACPFSYFLGNVLRIGSIETPEDIYSISPLERGSLIHKILDAFMRSVAESGTMPKPYEPWSADHRSALFRVAHEHFARAESDGVTGRPVMWELERALILADLDIFLERDAALRARFGVTPSAFEVGFGLSGSPWQEAVWRLDSGEQVRFRGMIDRVDMSPDGSTALVIDYKTGSARPYNGLENDPTDRGRRLQLGVYALAAQGSLERAENVRSAYWFVTTRGTFALAPREPVDGSSAEVRSRLGEVVGRIVSGIRSGVFPANPGERNARFGFENCGFCDFDSLCPSRRDRIWERKRDHPALAGYRDLIEES